MQANNLTRQFVDKYLVARALRRGDYYFGMMADSRGTDKHALARAIRKMPYDSFLNTPYWRLSSLQTKRESGWRCARCGARRNLVVHHENYRRHGYEMYHTHDLVCLCKSCHDRIHSGRALNKKP